MEQDQSQASTRFRPGESGNPAGSLSAKARQDRIEARARELAVEFGGYDTLSPVDRVLVEQAAQLLLRKPRAGWDVIRHANSVQRLLATVRRHCPRKADARPPSLDEYLDRKALSP